MPACMWQYQLRAITPCKATAKLYTVTCWTKEFHAVDMVLWLQALSKMLMDSTYWVCVLFRNFSGWRPSILYMHHSDSKCVILVHKGTVTYKSAYGVLWHSSPIINSIFNLVNFSLCNMWFVYGVNLLFSTVFIIINLHSIFSIM